MQPDGPVAIRTGARQLRLLVTAALIVPPHHRVAALLDPEHALAAPLHAPRETRLVVVAGGREHRRVEIRRERPSDHAAVRAVHRVAFGRAGQVGDVVEAVLVDRLRAGPWWLPRLSLVAVAEGEMVGHVVTTRATLEPSGAPVLGLGPLGVDPARQGQGIGSALMHAVLGAAEALDESVVGLLGDPAFYRRFGFVPAAEHGVAAPDPAWGAAFQLRVLSEPPERGTFRYAEPFERLG